MGRSLLPSSGWISLRSSVPIIQYAAGPAEPASGAAPWQAGAVENTLGDDVATALAEMVKTVETLPGQFKAEFRLEYWSGVVPPAEPWACTVEGDIDGDDGSEFTVLGVTAEAALRRASAEAWNRVPPKSG